MNFTVNLIFQFRKKVLKIATLWLIFKEDTLKYMCVNISRSKFLRLTLIFFLYLKFRICIQSFRFEYNYIETSKL